MIAVGNNINELYAKSPAVVRTHNVIYAFKGVKHRTNMSKHFQKFLQTFQESQSGC